MSKARELAELGNVYSDGALSNRNKLVNGNFDVWQRGTSGSSGHVADRWNNGLSGSTAAITQQAFTLGQTDVPNEPTYFHRVVVTSSAGAGNYAILVQSVEDVRTLAGQTATLSFWAKADAAKNIAVELAQNFGSGGSPSSAVTAIGVTTVALTTSWQKFTVTVTVPSISGKTLGTTANTSKLDINFWFDAGSDYNSRTNSLGQQSGTFDIAQVQLEVGDTATPFEHRSYSQELALCQRYYMRWQPKVNGGSTSYPFIGWGYATSSTAANYGISTPTTMRATPTVSFGGTVSCAHGAGGGALSSVAAVYEPADNNFAIAVTLAAAVLVTGYGGTIYLVNSTANYFQADAEL